MFLTIASRIVKYLFTFTFLRLRRAADSSYPWKCGGAPRIIPGSSTVQWRNYYPNIINQTYLEVRKVNDVWSQTGCLNSEEVIHSRSFYGTSASTIRYQFPSMDYDSLYIAKVFWIDRSSNAYYRNNSECYFIPQRSEYSHIPEALQSTSRIYA